MLWAAAGWSVVVALGWALPVSAPRAQEEGAGETVAAPRDAKKRSSIELGVGPAPQAATVESFLSTMIERAWTWQVARPGEGPADSCEHPFCVAVEWPDAERVVVTVRDPRGLLSRRELPWLDSQATMLTLWLFVRSTVERALTGPSVDVSPPPTEAVKASPQVRQPSSTEPARVAGDRKVRRVHAEATRMTVWAGCQIGNPRLASFGTGVGVEWTLLERGMLGAGVGYRLTPGVEVPGASSRLFVHHIPVRLSAGWQWRNLIIGGQLETGVRVVSSSADSRVLAMAQAGPFIQWAPEPVGSGSSVWLRVGGLGRFLRYRYTIQPGHLTESVWAADLAMGVQWR